MSIKTAKILIIIFVALVLFNIAAIGTVNYLLHRPQTHYTTDVLGAVFRTPIEGNVINVSLVRPPRVAVSPGEAVEQPSTMSNTATVPLYFRATYRIEIRDSKDSIIENFNDNVIVEFNDGWIERDGYWYYESAVDCGLALSGPIKSIYYSSAFSEHLDYKVYIPILIESVEVRDAAIEDVNYWPCKNIQHVSTKNLKAATWVNTVVIE